MARCPDYAFAGGSGGSVVAHNRIANVFSYDHTGYGSFGIYTDSGSARISFVSNTVLCAKDGAGFIHWGRHLTFAENNFLFTEPGYEPRVRRPPDAAYAIGAMLKLEEGCLAMAGRMLARTPPGSWTDVTLEVDFAGRRIVVTAVPASGGAPTTVASPFVSPLFSQVDTFEAMSPGHERCALALDDLSFDAPF